MNRASTDDADPAAGRGHAFAAAAWLESAARDIDQATDQLMAAFAANGQIAWQPAVVDHASRTTLGDLLEDRATQLSATSPPDPTTPEPRRPGPTR